MTASNSISMFRGDEKTIKFSLAITEDGITRPLTSGELAMAKIRFTAKRNLSDPDSAAVIALSSPSDGISIDLSGSACTVTIPPEATANVAALGAVLTYDLQVSNIDATQPHTFVVDTLAINGDVTRTI